MEKRAMKITHQDIIEKEFRVKFLGFDKAEVDDFLNTVAENFFDLVEENTLLNEKVLALQQGLETRGGLASQGQVELPAELGNILEDLKQDTASIGAELVALKQERQTFDSLKKNLEKVIAAVEESGAATAARPELEIPADLVDTLAEFKRNSGAIAAELTALEEERQAFDSLKKNLEELISSARDAVPQEAPPQGQVEIPAELSKTLADFKQGTESLAAELTALKQELGAIAGIRREIKQELQEQLSSHFEELAAGISAASATVPPAAPIPKAAPPAPGKKEKLLAAKIIEEPEPQEEDTRLPDYQEEDDGAIEDLEFLSEDDLLDVDKLRGIFQSVLDDGVSDGHESREGDEATADLLFLEEDFIEDEHEPEVTFSLDEKTETKAKSRKK